MFGFKLGSLFIGALTSTILLTVITLYLISRRNKGRDALYLTGYLCSILLLNVSYTIRYAFFSPLVLYNAQLSNTIVFGVVCLIQFAYHYGGNRRPRESSLVLIVSLVSAVALWGSLFFKESASPFYDFKNQYFSVIYGPGISLLTMAGFFWTVLVFIRESVTSDDRRRRRSNLSFALLTLFTAVLPLFYLLFQFNLISRNLFNMIFNTGSLFVCIAIFLVYVNNSPRPTSFMIKAVGIPLVIVLSSFGIITNSLMPVIHRTIASRYTDQIELVQSASFIKFEEQNLPATVAYVLPPEGWEEYYYLDRDFPGEYAPLLENARRYEGVFPESGGVKAEFFYLDISNSSSYFISFPMVRDERRFDIGFYYSEFLDTIHSFVMRITIIVLLTTAVILPLFPLIFKLGLVRPVERLLKAVNKVESGQYRMELPIQSEDELGQLSRGFNDMVLSLQNAEGNFKALAENANDGILILSPGGTILFSNRRAADITGHTVESLNGMLFSRLLPRESGRVRSLQFHSSELYLQGYGEKRIPVEVSSGSTRWHNDRAEVIVIRDISERKQAEETLQNQQLQLLKMDKMASLGALVAGVAHEVNNPNQVIAMNVHYLNEKISRIISLLENSGACAGDPDLKAELDDFRNNIPDTMEELGGSTRRIDHIVKELKRLVRGNENPEYEQVDINRTVQIVCDLSRHMIRKAAADFDLDLKEGLPPVSGDQIALEQVILNLLQNACQAMENSKGKLSVRSSLEDDNVIVEIEDEGSGIAEEDLPRITDSFFTTRSDKGGTGLGLSISARIIRDHGGRISFESRLKEGTLVRVSFPSLAL